ncbi:MAG TPA: response regulator [Polyangia bacterium]|nr:response regulator [Polyangia bacterium]
MAPVPAADRVDARTVLLADDDDDFRVLLAEALEDEGYAVIAVRSGAAVLGVLDATAKDRTRAPDLLVLDLLMPHMSGIEVLQRLRKSAEWASLPVLVVTAVNDPMLPVRLDVPIAFKPDAQTILTAVRQQFADRPVKARGRAQSRSP